MFFSYLSVFVSVMFLKSFHYKYKRPKRNYTFPHQPKPNRAVAFMANPKIHFSG